MIEIRVTLNGDNLFRFYGSPEQLLTRYIRAERCLKPGQRSFEIVPITLDKYIFDHETNTTVDNEAMESLILHALLDVQTSSGTTNLKLATEGGLDLFFDIQNEGGKDDYAVDVRARERNPGPLAVPREIKLTETPEKPKTHEIHVSLNGRRIFGFQGDMRELLLCYMKAQASLRPEQKSFEMVPDALLKLEKRARNEEATNAACQAVILHAMLSMECPKGSYLRLSEDYDLFFDITWWHGSGDKFDVDARIRPLTKPESVQKGGSLQGVVGGAREATIQKQRTPEASAKQTPDIRFMKEIPNGDSQPLASFKADQDEMYYYYYEHPQLIGEANGFTWFTPAYEYPQVIVVRRGQDPVLIIRSEKNSSGALFLCTLDVRGTHTNWGQISPMSRDNFVKEADRIVTQMKNETASVAPKEDGVSTHGRAVASGIEYDRDWTQINNETVTPKEDESSTRGCAASGMARMKPVPFNPSLPDVTKRSPKRAFSATNMLLLFLENVPSIGGVGIINYRFVLVAGSSPGQVPVCYVTLESSPFATNQLCAFDQEGGHANYATLASDNLETAFLEAAFDIVREKVGALDQLTELREKGTR
jgi:hypothetical protein